MNDQQMPSNVKEGLEYYKNEVLKSITLINSSKNILNKEFNKKEPSKTSYIHIVAISILLRATIETIANSSFSAQREKHFINKDNSDKNSVANFITNIEKINPNWLPEIIITYDNESNNIPPISKEEIKEYYAFLMTFYYETKPSEIDEQNWKNNSNIAKIVDTFHLVMERLLELFSAHKINLYDLEYSYIINVLDKDVSGTIKHK